MKIDKYSLANIQYDFIDENVLMQNIIDYIQPWMKLLDVGGRDGEFKFLAEKCKYSILEINKSLKGDNLIFGDICKRNWSLSSKQYDVVFSNNVFEHLKEPFLAVKETIRLTKIKGINIHIMPFSWRYHPCPIDYWRYTHDGIKYLFEKTGKVRTIFSGYDISVRRKNHLGGKNFDGSDKVPADELGGWREHWRVVYICERLK